MLGGYVEKTAISRKYARDGSRKDDRPVVARQFVACRLGSQDIAFDIDAEDDVEVLLRDFSKRSERGLRAASRIATAYGLPADPGVSITGFPFLTQVVSGSYQQIDVTAPNYLEATGTASVGAGESSSTILMTHQ